MTTETIKTTTKALLDAWDEFNREINNRPPKFLFVEDYARVELFKMLIEIETTRARGIIETR